MEDNVVIEAYYKQFSIDKRSILNKSEFSFFPSDKAVFTQNDMADLKQMDSPKAFMNRYMGFALDTATYFVETKRNPLENPLNPTLILEPKKQFFTFNPNPDLPHKSFDTLSALLEDYFQSETPRFIEIEKLIDKEIKRLELKLNHLYADLNDNLD